MARKNDKKVWTYEDVGCFCYASTAWEREYVIRRTAVDAGCYPNMGASYGWTTVDFLDYLNEKTVLPEGHAFGMRFDDFTFGLWPYEVLA